MAAEEGFTRLRTVLKVVGVLWAMLAVAVAINLSGREGGPVMFFGVIVGFAVPAGIVWGLFWIVEGFFINRGAR